MRWGKGFGEGPRERRSSEIRAHIVGKLLKRWEMEATCDGAIMDHVAKQGVGSADTWN